MLDHLEIRTRKMTDCLAFYQKVLAPLGYEFAVDGPAKGFGHDGRLDFWIVEGDPSIDVHYAFGAATRALVQQAFDQSESHGGAQDRAPALAPHIHPDYYAGYARDPDGRLVEFVCHTKA
jgi:catechol 2,3-dioxygenase-like lactoylglutathione lyase family enzyme